MFSLSVLLALLCLRSIALVNAALFILEPFRGTTCHGGQLCNVTWVDNGVEPLLNAIGVTTVGLYTGNQQLIQTLPPVNVETTSHLSFTPLSAAGPDSDNYYIAFTSTQLNVSEGIPYLEYSTFFRLRGMSGSFNSPLPAATSLISIPHSIKNPSTSSGTRTITVGTLSTSLSHFSSSSLPTPSVTSSVSRLSTSITPISSVSPSTTSSVSAPTKLNGSPSHHPGLLPVLFMALFFPVFFLVTFWAFLSYSFPPHSSETSFLFHLIPISSTLIVW